jgi:protein-tyrosine phosphatase
MIDIHCHILPGLDDGSADLTSSLRMAQAAVADGITTIIATPHHDGSRRNPALRIREAVREFQQELEARHIPLTVIPGQEARLRDSFLPDLAEGRIAALGSGAYVLLEFPHACVPQDALDILYELKVRKLSAVIAHPERNREIADNPDKLRELVEAGALSQITSHSLTGLFGSKVQKTALRLVKERLTHFVATDAHDPDLRNFNLKEAFRILEERCGGEVIVYLQENARRLAAGLPVEPRIPEWKPLGWRRTAARILKKVR